MVLTFRQLQTTKSLFDEKGWTNGHGKYDEEQLFEVICKFLNEVAPPNFDLAMELLSKYDVISSYTVPVRTLSMSLPDSLLAPDPCYLFPITEPRKATTKSGHAVTYQFKAIRSPLPMNVKVVDSLFSSRLRFERQARYIAFDDFIGTGDQFVPSLDYLLDHGVQADQIFVFVLCIQEEALARLNKLGVTVFTLISKPKALTDSYAIGNLSVADAKLAYEDMIADLTVPADLTFGYGEAEALVSMKRTPDNTLPLFWWEERKGGAVWPAPFPS